MPVAAVPCGMSLGTLGPDRIVDRRATTLAVLPVPAATAVVVAGLAPVWVAALPLVLCPLVVGVLTDTEDPRFDGVATAAVATPLLAGSAVLWVWLLRPELGTEVLLEVTTYSWLVGIPVVVLGTMFTAVLGAQLARLGDGLRRVATGETEVRFE